MTRPGHFPESRSRLYGSQLVFRPSARVAFGADLPYPFVDIGEGIDRIAGRETPWVVGMPGAGAPYTSINSAISDALESEQPTDSHRIVKILDGIYYENVVLRDGVDLVGESPNPITQPTIHGTMSMTTDVDGGDDQTACVHNIHLRCAGNPVVNHESAEPAKYCSILFSSCLIEQLADSYAIFSDSAISGEIVLLHCLVRRALTGASGTVPLIEGDNLAYLRIYASELQVTDNVDNDQAAIYLEGTAVIWRTTLLGRIYCVGAALVTRTVDVLAYDAAAIYLDEFSVLSLTSTLLLRSAVGSPHIDGDGTVHLRGHLASFTVDRLLDLSVALTIDQGDSTAPYDATTDADWPAGVPVHLKDAVDKLAARVKALEP